MKTPLSSMPLGRRKRSDEIAHHIERAISTGEFMEGAPMPSEKELARCQQHVRTVGNRAEAFEDILWALINSTEYQVKR